MCTRSYWMAIIKLKCSELKAAAAEIALFRCWTLLFSLLHFESAGSWLQERMKLFRWRMNGNQTDCESNGANGACKCHRWRRVASENAEQCIHFVCWNIFVLTWRMIYRKTSQKGIMVYWISEQLSVEEFLTIWKLFRGIRLRFSEYDRVIFKICSKRKSRG